MIAIGRYLLLIISLMGMTLSVADDRFSKEDIAKFLDYIFRLHIAVRFKHGLQSLLRTNNMDDIASEKLKFLCDGGYFLNEPYGINHNSMNYDSTTQLDSAEAKKFFSLWYEQGNFYEYTREPINHNAVDAFTQIVWKETMQIGLAFKCKENQFKVLAVYDPPGNLKTTYMLSVEPPLSSKQPLYSENHHLFYQTETEKFLNHIFKLHNDARIKHGVPLLERDDKADNFARKELHHMIRGRSVKRPRYYGMNHYEGNYDDNTILDAAAAKAVFLTWYDEGKNYNYDEEPQKKYAAAFTQIVWKNTEWFGIAIGKNEYVYIVVVYYGPTGNLRGQYKSNVKRPGSMDQGESSEDFGFSNLKIE